MSETAGPSFCPNCGAKLKPNAKFCTNCGYDLTHFNARSQQQAAQQQSTQQRVSQPNPNVEAAKKYSTNYFSWLWESIKHPSKVDLKGNKFFGITSFIIAALLIGITGMVALYRIIKELTLLINDLSSAINDINGQTDGNGSSFPNYPTGSGFTIFLKIFLIALIFMALFVLVGWLTRRYLIGDEHETYLGFATRLAGYTNLSLIFLLLGMVFIALLNTLAGAFLLFLFVLLTTTVYSIGYSYTILEFKQARGLDKVHALLIALIADGILTMILSSIVGASVI
ncbi:DUF6574 domain-containing protein [Secundilactobacillus hailunensis]|uniref:DUF6574 domain-containing protein n=1 Tax=Secundilactobacillus hailunensis TaxID=2559923 RepID=A0ABW1T5R0_9LACO|nr:zinc ribbon domain-containing protein [Secundilactobacillus hailunensis]